MLYPSRAPVNRFLAPSPPRGQQWPACERHHFQTNLALSGGSPGCLTPAKTRWKAGAFVMYTGDARWLQRRFTAMTGGGRQAGSAEEALCRALVGDQAGDPLPLECGADAADLRPAHADALGPPAGRPF